jgi:GNAT superfamily N-acetyltransferase
MIGSRVRLSKDRLRAQYLPQGAACSYARVTIGDRLAGNVFACRWNYNGRTVCWVTQLVVHRHFRERGIAVSLLNQIRQDDDGLYGLMSSHPAACLAAAKAFGSKCIL